MSCGLAYKGYSVNVNIICNMAAILNQVEDKWVMFSPKRVCLLKNFPIKYNIKFV